MNEYNYIKNNFGKWSQPGIPHKGWVCVDIKDLGEPSAVCEMCEKTEIRYVHYMKHDDYKDKLGVGCICAGHMEEDILSAKRRDDFMKSRSAKRKKWLIRNWKTSSKGNEYIKSDGYVIVIKFNNGYWSAFIESVDKTFNKWSRKKYKTENEVKLASFDYLTKILSEKH